MPLHKYSQQEGFTLLEILVSFTLLSVILTMMYSGISMIYRASDKGEVQVNANTQVRTTQRFLRRQLSGALPTKAKSEFTLFPIFFLGDSKKVEFMAKMPGHLRSGGIYKQTIEFLDDNEEPALVFRFEPLIPSLDETLESAEPVILMKAKDVRFSYLDKKEEQSLDSESWNWVDEWGEFKSQLPTLIRIEAEFAEESELFWPSLIIAPLHQASTQ